MTIKHFDPQALRDYVRSHHENTYDLVDVRQPEEYSRSHIPGAKLIPLPELVQDMEKLPADKEVVFYCHSGGRSMSAAIMAEEAGFKGNIFNLTGGMLAWDGGRVADFPRIDLFAGQSTVEMFRTAMNLEKGAQIFYETIGREYGEKQWGQIFGKLAKAEVAHAKTVYGHWQKIESRQEDFEAMYDGLSGEVLEGGMPLREALGKISAASQSPCLRLVEFALQIEFTAYDLYRTLAGQITDQDANQAFTQLAQAEKAHMQALIEAIGTCEV